MLMYSSHKIARSRLAFLATQQNQPPTLTPLVFALTVSTSDIILCRRLQRIPKQMEDSQHWGVKGD